MTRLTWLDPRNHNQPFPNPEQSLAEPNGLLAVGGDLSPKRLLNAYRNGIFPWYSSDQPILWWSPDPRMVLFPENLKISRSLRKVIKRDHFRVTMDKAFRAVIQCCSEPRPQQSGTWITQELLSAYSKLYQLGYGHSVETWYQEELVGGLYGLAIGRVFFGESMFSRMNDASKVALVALTVQLSRWNFTLIDCQMHTEHLRRLGAADIPRRTFVELLKQYCPLASPKGIWHFEGWPATLVKS
jgi:leucyl/phenylalanyl-tRNA--protein transferase